MWRPISWRAQKTHVTRDVGAQACVKTLTMIFANVRAVFVRAFIIKSALLETGHVSRSQTVCLVSKRYNSMHTVIFDIVIRRMMHGVISEGRCYDLGNFLWTRLSGKQLFGPTLAKARSGLVPVFQRPE